MLKILLICSVIQVAIDVAFAEPGEHKTAWIDGVAIFLTVMIVAFVGSWNDYKREAQFLKLQAIYEKDNNVSIMNSDDFVGCM